MIYDRHAPVQINSYLANQPRLDRAVEQAGNLAILGCYTSKWVLFFTNVYSTSYFTALKRNYLTRVAPINLECTSCSNWVRLHKVSKNLHCTRINFVMNIKKTLWLGCVEQKTLIIFIKIMFSMTKYFRPENTRLTEGK